MQQFRECIPKELWARAREQLGLEESLRLVWPLVVGPSLARNAVLKAVRGRKLVIAVPDGAWHGAVRSLEPAILDAVNRFWQEEIACSIELMAER